MTLCLYACIHAYIKYEQLNVVSLLAANCLCLFLPTLHRMDQDSLISNKGINTISWSFIIVVKSRCYCYETMLC